MRLCLKSTELELDICKGRGKRKGSREKANILSSFLFTSVLANVKFPTSCNSLHSHFTDVTLSFHMQFTFVFVASELLNQVGAFSFIRAPRKGFYDLPLV
jgi:hypothetical protein